MKSAGSMAQFFCLLLGCATKSWLGCGSHSLRSSFDLMCQEKRKKKHENQKTNEQKPVYLVSLAVPTISMEQFMPIQDPYSVSSEAFVTFPKAGVLDGDLYLASPPTDSLSLISGILKQEYRTTGICSTYLNSRDVLNFVNGGFVNLSDLVLPV